MNSTTIPAEEPLLLTIRQTAAALQICEKTLWGLTRDGRLPSVRIGRAVRYDRRDVERYIQAAKSWSSEPG